MPILQRDANNNTVSIKTLNDINAGSPLAVQIAQTLSATDTIVQTNIGGTNSAPATAPNNNTGLNGIFKGYWTSFLTFLSAFGTVADVAAQDGTLMARLRWIAMNGVSSGGSGGGTTPVVKPTILNYSSVAASAGANVKSSAGRVYSVSCLNLATDIRYLQLFNDTTPTGTPLESIAVYPDGGQLALGQDYFSDEGLNFSTAISWGISSTPTVYTAGSSADAIVNIKYAESTPVFDSLTLSQYAAIGISAGANVKSSAGKVYGLSCLNLAADVRYLQLFNAATPTGTPIESFAVYPDSGQVILGQDYFTDSGLSFSTGISFGFSTTAATYTAGTASDCVVVVKYA